MPGRGTNGIHILLGYWSQMVEMWLRLLIRSWVDLQRVELVQATRRRLLDVGAMQKKKLARL